MDGSHYLAGFLIKHKHIAGPTRDVYNYILFSTDQERNWVYKMKDII
jgi:hypothetical protein